MKLADKKVQAWLRETYENVRLLKVGHWVGRKETGPVLFLGYDQDLRREVKQEIESRREYGILPEWA